MMKFCHECGSEVAENSVFCTFCGITLQSSAVEIDEDLQEKTIAVNQAEWEDLVKEKIDTEPKDAEIKTPPEGLPVKSSDILPAAEDELFKQRKTKEELELPPNITAENWSAHTDSINLSDLSAQVVPKTDEAQAIPGPDDAFELTSGKEVTDRDRDSSANSELEAFDKIAEVNLKSQVELQRMIFVQNQRIIELLEQLLKKK